MTIKTTAINNRRYLGKKMSCNEIFRKQRKFDRFHKGTPA